MNWYEFTDKVLELDGNFSFDESIEKEYGMSLLYGDISVKWFSGEFVATCEDFTSEYELLKARYERSKKSQ